MHESVSSYKSLLRSCFDIGSVSTKHSIDRVAYIQVLSHVMSTQKNTSHKRNASNREQAMLGQHNRLRAPAFAFLGCGGRSLSGQHPERAHGVDMPQQARRQRVQWFERRSSGAIRLCDVSGCVTQRVVHPYLLLTPEGDSNELTYDVSSTR